GSMSSVWMLMARIMESASAPARCYTAAMSWPRRHLRSLAWFALVAMLALALAPTASRAAAAFANGPWSAVCSTAEPLAPAPHDGSGAALHVDHCPLCSHGGTLPALPAGAWVVVQPAGLEPLPPFLRAAPRARAPASLAQPRAPP